ncbi:MAG TPA: four helix bundle protein [Candidatus Cloacimonadota bacterium]|nr:four helix bundle protein [Candidatus Cloacimonadota bacterium]HPT71148.1 four helix bundle protein [Candidatus Cloacimonadota bacterium]
MIQSYRDLIVWQKAMDYAFEVYQLSRKFPKEELYSLTNQIQRAAISIPSNIAEGKGRTSKAEFAHFISIALGSLAETETQILLSIRLQYITDNQAKLALNLREEISKMLVTLYLKLTMS